MSKICQDFKDRVISEMFGSITSDGYVECYVQLDRISKDEFKVGIYSTKAKVLVLDLGINDVPVSGVVNVNGLRTYFSMGD